MAAMNASNEVSFDSHIRNGSLKIAAQEADCPSLPSQERDEIQRELHVELLPGTEIMADIGSHHFIKSGDNAHRVLVPQPSEDANDPLNWSPFWKTNAMFAVQWMTFTQGFAPLSLAPMFPFIMEEYNSSLADVVQFTGVTILVLGFSNFIWLVVPLSPPGAVPHIRPI